jgi:hypothetical protein
MDSTRFIGLGFVASFWNADPNTIAPLDVVDKLAVQIVWGDRPSERTEPPDELANWISRCHTHGFKVLPWGWCNSSNPDTARAEGRYHAERAIGLGFRDSWIANMEAPYDAHGDSSSIHYKQPAAYMEGFVARAAELGVSFQALGVTTTPFFASSTWELAGAGWVTMPQAFQADYPEATVARCVEHMEGWGWPVAQQRPLVQVYKSKDGQRPAAQPYLDDSAAKQVGVVPYIVEQALDDEGRALLKELVPATMRPPQKSPENGGEEMPVGTVTSLRLAWTQLEAANTDDAWRRDNPGEVSALVAYWNAPPGTEPPSVGSDGVIRTRYGQALLAITEARRYAEGSHS